jgi:MFS family permease
VEDRARSARSRILAPYRLPLLVGAIVAFALFLVVVRRAPWPILPLGLFRRPVFSAANLANLLVGAALIVVMVDVPFVVSLLAPDTNRAGLISALLLLPFTLAMAAGSLVGGAITERAGYRTVALGGLLIAAVGFWRLWGWPDSLVYGRMTADLLICGLGLGLVIAPVGAAAINSVREGDYGIASSLVLVMRLLGMTLGLSALTSWGAGRLDALVRALPTLAQRADETPIAFLIRQTEYQAQQVLVLTLDILHQTFAIAGVLCLLALLPACLLSGGGRHDAEHGARAVGQ